MDSRKVIKIICEELDIPGYKPKYFEGNKLIIKKNEDTTEEIWFNSSDRYFQSFLEGKKHFHIVENLYEKHAKLNVLSKIGATINHNSEWDRSIEELPIYSPESVQLLIPKFKILIEKDILPFFEKYQTLEQVYEKMESLPLQEMSGFVGSMLPVRRLIIKALVKAPDFIEYGDKIVKRFRENANKELVYSQINKFLPGLYNELKEIYAGEKSSADI